MKSLNRQLWGRALDRAVPETYTTLNAYQLSKVIDEYTELIVKECMTICEDVAERNDPAIACYYEIKRTFWS